MSGQILVKGGTAPATPGATYSTIYSKTADRKLYVLDEGGIESCLLVRTPINYAINGGFDVNQRSTTGSFTACNATSAADKYSADRWKVAVTNADVSFQRTDTNGALEGSLNARYYGTYKKITNTAKLVVFQILEAVNTFPLAGRKVTFQCKLKASGSIKFRLGIIQLSSTGTVDAWPAATTTAVGGTGTDPTLGTNLAYVTAVSVPTGAQGTIVGNAVDCNATTSWQQFAGTFTLPANAKNIAIAIWSDATLAANDTVSMSEVQLIDGSLLQDYTPPPVQQELARCQRYYCVFGTRTSTTEFLAMGQFVTTTNLRCGFSFPVDMRTIPTIAANGTINGTNYNVQNQGNNYAPSAVALVANSIGTRTAMVDVTTAVAVIGVAGMFMCFTTTGQIQFDAEL